MGYKERYEERQKNKAKSYVANKAKNSQGYKERYQERLKKSKLQSSINIDTLQSDITSVNNSINAAYNGWQTRETMENTRSAIQSIYDRLGKYQEYTSKYGGTDLSELHQAYKGVLDGWDGLSREYSKTKNADEYNKMVQSAKERLAEDEKAKTDDLGKVKTEIDELEKIYNDVKKYDDDVKKLLPNGATRASNDPNKLARLIKEAETKRDDYAKSIGYESYEALENLLGKKKNYYNRAQWIQKGINLASPSTEDKDFEKKSQYVQPEEKYGIQFVDNNEDIYKYINDKVFRDDYISSIESSGEAAMASVGYEYMTDEEKKQYNYYYNSGDKKKAREYLNTITESLGARKAVADYESYKGNTAKELLFGVNAGLDQFAQGIKNVFNSNDEYIPVNATQQLSGMIRDDLNYEHGNWGKVPYDFITTTSNMLPSILTSTVIGKVNPGLGAKVGTALMGASAGGNAYQEMVNLGYDPKQARAYALLVGVSESSLQSMMGGIGKLGGVGKNLSTAIKSIDNAFARFAINYGRSMVAEGIEEATQEVLNPIFKNLAAGYDTGEKIDWGEVVYSGLLGAMSGGLWEGGPAISNARAEVHTGADIKTNERVSDMFDLANNPKIAEAYETYTRYAKKGITADNITNAQLGRLYNEVKSDAVEKMNSKNSTDEQRASGMQTLGKLSLMKTENTIAKEKSKLNVGEETKVTETGEAVDIKALKVKGEDVVLNTEKGEVSTDKITLADTDADIVAHAKVIARTDGEDIANLFLSQYNGETNIDEYANSFNLTVAYAKNDFNYKEILENKGKLSADQVSTIYAEARDIAVKENQKAIDELNKKMADGKFYKGIIDESVINYGEEDVEGKVKWTSLTSRQRQAVTFIKGFAQATGMNLAFVANNPDYNGNYDKTSNTITINLDEGGFDAIKNIEETIIPTMSHETTHWMKNKSPELWENLNNIVFSTLTEHYNSNKDLKLKKALVEVIDGKTYTDEELKSRTVTKDDLIDAEYYRLADKAKKDGKKVDEAKLYDTAKEEIIARACEDILSMSEQGRKIFKSLSESEQKTLVDKIKAIINDLLNWVDELLHSYKATSKEAQIMREYKEELQKAVKVWDKMLEESIVANQSLEKSGAFKHDGNTEDELYSRKIDRKSKSYYNEYQTNALIWAKATERQPGDLKILNANGKYFALIEATEDGFIELAKGNYKEMKSKYEQAYSNAVDEIYGNLESYETDKGRDNWDMQFYGEGRNGNGNPQQIKSQRLQDNSTRNDEHLRNGNKGKLGKSEITDDVRYSEKNKSVWEATLNIANTTNGEKILYDIDPIKMVEQAVKSATSTTNNSILNPDKNVKEMFSEKEINGDNTVYSEKVTDEETLDFLNNQETLKVYRAMQVIDGKLYPPMAARIKGANGKKELVYSSEIGTWEQATEHPELIKEGKFNLDKANGSSINAAYNPYIHTSASPLNDQFSSAYKRANLVTVEGKIPISELSSGYKAEYAKDSVGETKWHSGPVASKLKGEKSRRVYLSRWFKPTRIVPDYEVASIIAKTLEGENVSVPYNVVTPSLRNELEKNGVSILYSDKHSADEDMLNNSTKSDKMEVKGNIEFDDEFDTLFNEAISEVKITKVSMKVFPPYNISHSDANQHATRWAHKESVETGAQAIAFYKNGSYIIEKFDNTELKYIIIGRINYDDYRNIRRELEANAKNRKTESVEELATIYDKRNRQRDTTQGRGQSADSVAIEHREQSKFIQRLDKDKNSKWKAKSNSDRSDERNGTNKQIGSLEETEFFSEKEQSIFDTMGEADRIKKEHEKFKAEIERLKERLAIEKRVTNGKVLNDSHILKAAGHLRNISRSNIDKVTLAKKLKELYTFINQAENLTWEEVFGKSYHIADAMLKEATPEKVIDDYAKLILRDIRGKRISLSEAQKKEAGYIFGKNWNRNFFGRVIITDDAISLERQWQEWANEYPDIFNADITDTDMPGELYDIIGTLQDASETIAEYDMAERTRWLANEVYNQYWNISNITTTADKYDKRIKLLNAEHRRNMTELRENYNTRLKEQHNLDKEKQKKLVKDIRERKDKQIALAKEHGKERLDKYKENAQRKTYIQRITANALSLNDMLVKNSKDKHIPEIMREPVTALLKAIDFSSKRLLEKGMPTQKDISLSKALRKVRDMMVEATNTRGELVELYGHGLDDDIKKMMESVDSITEKVGDNEFVINRMTLADLKTLNEMVKTIKTAVNKLNEFHIVNHTKGIADLSQTTVEELNELGQSKIYDTKSKKAAVKKLLDWGNALPYYVFKRFGKGGIKIYEALQDGWDKFAFNVKKIIDYTNSTYTNKEVNKWSKEVKTFKINIDGLKKRNINSGRNDSNVPSMYVQDVENNAPNGIVPQNKKIIKTDEMKIEPKARNSEENSTVHSVNTIGSNESILQNKKIVKTVEVEMTIPQIMALYCINKREQGRKHLLQGGIRIADFKNKNGKIVSQTDGILLNEEDIQMIISNLTDRQKEVADKLQEFMNTVCTEWGNEVSMARFGYKAFGEENYFPIQSDENNLAVNDETEQQNSLFRLLNMSFTKSTDPNANNRIVISDIFDVFAQHTSDMAKYNALALPVLDAFKWYNYVEREYMEDGTFKTNGVKQSIERAFGKDGQNYFTTFFKDINGSQEVDREQLSKSFMRNYKIASVGANLRVILLQPTSYARASAVIDNKYLLKASAYIKLEPVGMFKKLKKAVSNAEKYCGIALWKSMGYFDTNIQRSVTEQIKHDKTFRDKATDFVMKGAEIADKATFGTLWVACEFEIRETRKDLKVGSDEFYTEIGKRLREVIYATQVVDSTMTRSQIMRSRKMYDQIATNFASEPTLSYNMLQDAYMEYALDARQMGKKDAIKKNAKRIARILTAYTMTNAIAALVESGFDAFFDDDDEEEMDMIAFMKLYLGNFASDMSITGKIPYIKEIHSLIRGYGLSRTELKWMESLYKAITGMYKNLQGKGNPITTIKKTIESISYISSFPFYNVYRYLMATLDKLDLFDEDDLNEMFEDFLD